MTDDDFVADALRRALEQLEEGAALGDHEVRYVDGDVEELHVELYTGDEPGGVSGEWFDRVVDAAADVEESGGFVDSSGLAGHYGSDDEPPSLDDIGNNHAYRTPGDGDSRHFGRRSNAEDVGFTTDTVTSVVRSRLERLERTLLELDTLRYRGVEVTHKRPTSFDVGECLEGPDVRRVPRGERWPLADDPDFEPPSDVLTMQGFKAADVDDIRSELLFDDESVDDIRSRDVSLETLRERAARMYDGDAFTDAIDERGDE